MSLSNRSPFKPSSPAMRKVVHIGKLFGALSRSTDLTLYISDVIYFSLLYPDPMNPQTQHALMQWRREFDYIVSIYPRVVSDYSIYQAMRRIDALEGSYFTPIDAAAVAEHMVGDPVHRIVVRSNWATNPLALMVIRRLWEIPNTERRLIEIREDREGLFTLKELDNSVVLGMIRSQSRQISEGIYHDISHNGRASILGESLDAWKAQLNSVLAV